MEETKKKKNEFIYLILSLCFLYIIYNYIENDYFNEIKSYKSETIGKTNKIISAGQGNIFFEYYFYYDNKKYSSTSKHNNINRKNLKKFFLVVFDEKKPENSHIYLENEIKPDSIKMIKAGFKHSYYYEHDIPTNTYIKKHKWE